MCGNVRLVPDLQFASNAVTIIGIRVIGGACSHTILQVPHCHHLIRKLQGQCWDHMWDGVHPSVSQKPARLYSLVWSSSHPPPIISVSPSGEGRKYFSGRGKKYFICRTMEDVYRYTWSDLYYNMIKSS